MNLKNLTKVCVCAALMMGSQLTMNTAYAAAPDKELQDYEPTRPDSGKSAAEIESCIVAAELVLDECLVEGVNSTSTCYHIYLVNESSCY